MGIDVEIEHIACVFKRLLTAALLIGLSLARLECT
jgi:hypothetical protein